MAKKTDVAVCKVDVHLREHETVEGALVAWSGEIRHLRRIRENKAENLDRLREADDYLTTPLTTMGANVVRKGGCAKSGSAGK